MLDYRLYSIDQEGRFFRCEEFQALGDNDAIDAAKSLKGAPAAELWSGARMVTSFAAAAGSAA